MRLLIIFCLSFLALTANAAGQEKPAAAASDRAIVYFYSYSTVTTLGQVRKPVYLDDDEICDIRPEHYFIAVIAPGKHAFHLKNKKFGGIEKEFAAGETYYLRMEWKAGGKLTPAGISLVAPDSGAFDIKQLRPVDKKNIKDESIVFLSLPDAGLNQ